MDRIKDAFQTGGVTLSAIIVMSVIALFVVIERLLATQGIRERVRTLTDALIKRLYEGDADAARLLCEKTKGPEGAMFGAALGRYMQHRAGVETALERERAILNQWLRHRMWMLGTIAASAPFIGLFGTVIGIMQSFRDIAETGGGGFAVVSRGLSEALITTAAGIIVAVEAVVFYNFLQARLGGISFQIKLDTEEFLEVLADRPRAGHKSAAAHGESHGELQNTRTAS